MSKPTAAVVGLGVSGRSAATLLTDAGYDVVIFDQSGTQLPEDLADVGVQLRTIASAADLGNALVDLRPDQVVVSPGVPQNSPIVREAIGGGLDVISEVEVAWQLAPSTKTKWLAITGTNGKTTTVGMVDSILKAAGVDAVQTGNVGYPVAKAVVEDRDVLVVELSSFQLANVTTVAPWASICLNIDVDHLDWHGSVEEYRRAKARVYERCQAALFAFADDPTTMEMARDAKRGEHAAIVPLSFTEVDEGEIGIENGLLIDRASLPIEAPDRTRVIADLTEVPLLRGPLASQDGKGSPLVRDALAAAALAVSIGVEGEDIVTGLTEFQAAPHRFALIPSNDNKTWVDDSKATNTHAAAAALANVAPGSTVWIVGGDAKGQDLEPLIERAAKVVKAAVVIGAEQQALLDIFASAAPNLQVVPVPGKGDLEEWMEEVVRACNRLSQPGDTVLLAPACASWDQFASYSQRGNIFREAVQRIGSEG